MQQQQFRSVLDRATTVCDGEAIFLPAQYSSECAKKSECHLGQHPEGIEEGKGSGPIEVQRQGEQKVSYLASNSICLPPVQT